MNPNDTAQPMNLCTGRRSAVRPPFRCGAPPSQGQAISQRNQPDIPKNSRRESSMPLAKAASCAYDRRKAHDHGKDVRPIPWLQLRFVKTGSSDAAIMSAQNEANSQLGRDFFFRTDIRSPDHARFDPSTRWVCTSPPPPAQVSTATAGQSSRSDRSNSSVHLLRYTTGHELPRREAAHSMTLRACATCRRRRDESSHHWPLFASKASDVPRNATR